MAQAVWDAGNRKIGTHPERDALRPKRIPAEPQQDEQKDHQKPKQRIPTLMFHYRSLAV